MKKLLVLGLIGVAVLAAESRGQSLLWSRQGFVAQDMLGASLAVQGDVDGDGRPDLAVGAPHALERLSAAAGNFVPPLTCATAPGQGSVQILSGAGGGLIRVLTDPVVPTGICTLFGFAVESPGDVDGDGVADLVVGVPGANRLNTFSGSSGGLIWTATANGFPCINVPGGGGFLPYCFGLDCALGQALATIGDVNGDGFPDVVAAAPKSMFNLVGSCTVVSGFNGALLQAQGNTGFASQAYGLDVAAGRDVNGDGVNDWITASDSSRVFYAYSGTDSSILLGRLEPEVLQLRLGHTVELMDDQDGDGLADMLYGAPRSQIAGFEAGRVVILGLSSAVPIATFLGSAAGDFFGHASAVGGDFDGDGIDDFAISGPQIPDTLESASLLATGPGYVRVYSGATRGLITTLVGPSFGSGFGYAVEFLGDLDGDGSSELAVGAPFVDQPAQDNVGEVFVYRGIPFVPGAAAGNVGVPLTAPQDLLQVNGSAGGISRRVTTGIGQPLGFAMLQPSTRISPAQFAIFGAIGPFDAVSTYPTAIGSFAFTPLPAAPADPLLFALADSTATIPAALLPAQPSPWSHLLPSGLPFPAVFRLQGAIEDRNIPAFPGNLAVTNAIQVTVQ